MNKTKVYIINIFCSVMLFKLTVILRSSYGENGRLGKSNQTRKNK